MAQRDVTVDVDKKGNKDEYKITVDPSTIGVSVANHDHVVWTTNCDKISVTHLGGKLFANSRPFEGDANNPAQSGPVVENATVHSRRDYKITVERYDITFVIDPRVRVDP